jgi:hypothetical protein
MHNLVKLQSYGTQDEDKQNKNTKQYVSQANTYNINITVLQSQYISKTFLTKS